MSVLLEFAMFPTDKGESVSNYVSRIVQYIDKSGYSYKLTPMGTIVETSTMDEALDVIKQSYLQLEPDCNRIYTSIKFDIRKDKENCLEAKIKSIEDKIGNIKK